MLLSSKTTLYSDSVFMCASVIVFNTFRIHVEAEFARAVKLDRSDHRFTVVKMRFSERTIAC